MGIEIERKFLVTGDDWRSAHAVYYSQGYLSRAKERTVRVRIVGEQAFLTVKGINEGASRAEFEYPIPVWDAQELLKLCEQPLIAKYRREIVYEGFVWEVDEFLDENTGLVVAEIELPTKDTVFARPDWVGEEVTEDARYYNSSLSQRPYKYWSL